MYDLGKCTAFLYLLAALFARRLTASSFTFQAPNGWTLVGLAHEAQSIKLRVHLNPQNLTALDEILTSISTPSHVLYGQHLKREATYSVVQPSSDTVSMVVNWATSAGLSKDQVMVNRSYVELNTNVEQASNLLQTRYCWFEEQKTKVRILRSTGYTMPAKIREVVATIQPTDYFSQLRSHTTKPDRASGKRSNRYWVENQVGLEDITCNHNITPSCLRDLYNIKYKADARKGGKIGFTSFLNEVARNEDMTAFQKQYAPWILGQKLFPVLVNGGVDDQHYLGDASEGNLDSQYFMAIAGPLPITEFIVGGRGPLIPDLDQPELPGSNEPYMEFLDYLLDLDDEDLPHTITSSYGENEQEIPPDYARLVCNKFGQLAARGVSMLVSSGDGGVGQACQTNDGTNTTRFNAIFPASCPYVTSVGGTMHIYPERAVEFSSGGFSDIFPRPKYQERFVSAYLDRLGYRWAGLYNPSGRGFPDVAAQSATFTAIDKGLEAHISGTSAAAPVFAGIIALLNAARISSGLPPLGFLNPWLYDEGYKALSDINRGGSNGCLGTDQYSNLSTPVIPYASWNATVGWDPVTGLGTPDFAKMFRLVGPPS